MCSLDATSSLPFDPTSSYNADILNNLKEDESLDVNEKGQLIVSKATKGIFSFRGSSCKDPELRNQAILQGIEHIVLKESKDPDAMPTETVTKITKIVAQLGKKGILTQKKQALDKLHLMTDHQQIRKAYRHELNSLLMSGKDSLTATLEINKRVQEDSKVCKSFKDSVKPELVDAGGSGVYFIKDTNGIKIGVFKPCDEEAFMPNNPKGLDNPEYAAMDLRYGFTRGQTHLREIGSYLVARALFKDKVPIPETRTCHVVLPEKQGEKDPHPKLVSKFGSIQRFSDGKAMTQANDLTEALQSVPSNELHRSVLLSLTIGDNDRNFGNILLEESDTLVNIDQGMGLGEELIASKENPHPRSGLSLSMLYHYKLDEPINPKLISAFNEFPLESVKNELKKLGLSKKTQQALELRYKTIKLLLSKGFNLRQITRMFTSEGSKFGNGFFNTAYNEFLSSISLKEAEKLSSAQIDNFLIFFNKKLDPLPENYLSDLPLEITSVCPDAAHPGGKE